MEEDLHESCAGDELRDEHKAKAPVHRYEDVLKTPLLEKS